MKGVALIFIFFFLNDTAPTEIYPLSLHAALPISTPAVREVVMRTLGGMDNIRLIDPLDYVDFVWFMQRAHIILTDSGGVQEEAPYLGKPVLVIDRKSVV